MEEIREKFQTLHEIVDAAYKNLDANFWGYLSGGAEAEVTLQRNRQSLDSIAFRPRVLRDVSTVDCGGSFLGHKTRLPVLLAPVGSLESFHPEGGKAALRAASRFGVPLFLSSVTTLSMEEVTAAGDGVKVYCLYRRGDDAWLDDEVKKVVDCGFHAFGFTVDSAHYSRRERDIAQRFQKSWRDTRGMEYQASLNWDDIKRFKDTYDMPLILKGIATAEDAALAVELGVEMIYVSNHGGRQLDHGLGSAEALREVVAEVDGRAEIAVDGSFLRGTDLAKARALGADIVGIGRMLCAGLAAGGADGVERVLELMEIESEIALGLIGVTAFDQLGSEHLTEATPTVTPSVFSAYPLFKEK